MAESDNRENTTQGPTEASAVPTDTQAAPAEASTNAAATAAAAPTDTPATPADASATPTQASVTPTQASVTPTQASVTPAETPAEASGEVPATPAETSTAPVETPAESSPPPLDFEDTPLNAAGEIQIDDFSDEFSEFEEESDITSLSSSVLDYEYENGRRYHSNRAGNYWMPNDEEEQDRMDLAHHLWLIIMKGELYKAPVKNPQNVLDLGTGTGIWAIDMAEKFPNARVIGNDISPIQPSWVAPNLEFIVEDFEKEWLYERESFDFIHARLLSGCVTDWPLFLRRVYDHLKPGSYFEIQESAVWAWSDDGTLKDDSPLMEYLRALSTATQMTGRVMNVYHKMKDWLLDAGFEDVQQFVYVLPYSPWPRDPFLKELGKWQAVHVQQAVTSYGLRLCTQVLGWGVEPSKIFQAVVKSQLRDRHMHAYTKEVVVYGRKPFR